MNILNQKNFLLTLILILSAVVYLPALENDFLLSWDDDIYVVKNADIRELSFASIRAFFTSVYNGTYVPLAILSFSVEYYIVGLAPFLYHLVNVLLHLINTALVFIFIYKLALFFEQSQQPKTSVALKLAALSAFLFGIHTIHVESVAWVTERKDVLYATFFFSSLIFYLKHIEANSQSHRATTPTLYKFYFLSLFTFILSLFSKGQAVSLSLILIAIDGFVGRNMFERDIFRKKVLLEKIPFFILSLIFGIVALYAQAVDQIVSSTESFTFFQKIIFLCYGFTLFLSNLALPVNISAFYPFPIRAGESLPYQYYFYPVFVFVVIGTISFVSRHSKLVTFGSAFFVLNILFVLETRGVGTVIGDRFVYVASVGFFFLIATGYLKISEMWSKSKPYLFIAFILYGTQISLLSFERCKVWKSSHSLWSDVISKYPKSSLAFYNRGVASGEAKEYYKAISDYDNAIKHDPSYVDAYINRGNAKNFVGNNNGALADYNMSLKLTPDSPEIYFNKGITQLKIGHVKEGCSSLRYAYKQGFVKAKTPLIQRCR